MFRMRRRSHLTHSITLPADLLRPSTAMGNYRIILCCLAVLLQNADAAMTGFTKPAQGGAVTIGVKTGELTTVATVVIEDGTAAATTITTVEGVSGDSGTIVYSLTDTDIEIDSTSGAVKTKSGYAVNYATKPSFTLTVTAVDANTTVTATLTLTVTVTVNDIPTFTSPTLCWEIASNASIGTTVGTYTASAGTVGSAITSYAIAYITSKMGSTITYTIAAGDTNLDFSKTLTSGILVTAKTLASATYTLVIQAVDNGAAPATGSISVTITRMADGATTQECTNGISGLVSSLIFIITALTAKFM